MATRQIRRCFWALSITAVQILKDVNCSQFLSKALAGVSLRLTRRPQTRGMRQLATLTAGWYLVFLHTPERSVKNPARNASSRQQVVLSHCIYLQRAKCSFIHFLLIKNRFVRHNPKLMTDCLSIPYLQPSCRKPR